jgi:hypothetical protein
MDCMNMPGLDDQLKWANETLDAVQKSLEAYLETKRQGEDLLAYQAHQADFKDLP